MKLQLLDSTFSIVKLPPAEPIPSWASRGELSSITRTGDELSIVCPSEAVPEDAGYEDIEHGWSCIKVDGVLDFALTGILASLAQPLAANQISLFAISTYKTDYLLVKTHSIEQAKLILERSGHKF